MTEGSNIRVGRLSIFHEKIMQDDLRGSGMPARDALCFSGGKNAGGDTPQMDEYCSLQP
jgi:hypothetical protein